ncbi:MAG: hypothetical protein GY866_26940 [Proteobacteria bacterium]|nr:hypothetical protein [Pseudomonadota bacterium]
MKREKNRYRILLTAAVCILLISPVCVQAGTIGKGSAKIFNNNEGSARNQALQNALRDAVKQGVGLLLDSKTVVKNWAVIQDEVYSSARGFVKNYTIIKDEKQNDTWYVEIDAEVASGQIKDKLANLRILHKKMGNKRLMVIYRPEHPDSLEAKNSAVLSALISIPAELNRSGFRVFDQRSLDRIYDSTSQTGGTQEAWMKIADQHQVDMLVEFELVSGSKSPFSRSKYKAAKVNIRMRVYDVSTGRLISNAQTTQKQMTNARTGSYDWDNAVSQAAEKAGKTVTVETVDKIVEFYKSVGDIGNGFLIVFKNFTEDEEDTILDTLENLDGYQSLSELQNEPQLLKIEYFSTMEKSRLRRKIRQACKSKRIKLRSKKTSGNRFVFVKP